MKHRTFEKWKWFCFVLFLNLSFLYYTLVAACGSWAPGRWRWEGRGCSRRSQPPAVNHDDEDDDYDDEEEDEGDHEDDDENEDGGGGKDDDADVLMKVHHQLQTFIELINRWRQTRTTMMMVYYS